EWTEHAQPSISFPASRTSLSRNRSCADRTASPIAIVGLGAHFGPFDCLRSFKERALLGGQEVPAATPGNWWGIPETQWFRNLGHEAGELSGFFIDHLEFRVDQFRIPPKELGEMLPQQLLMLKVAAEAIEDSRWDNRLSLSTGVLIGIGLDLNTTNYHLRWSLEGQIRRLKPALAPSLSTQEFDKRIAELKDAAAPPLSANRTTGS